VGGGCQSRLRLGSRCKCAPQTWWDKVTPGFPESSKQADSYVLFLRLLRRLEPRALWQETGSTKTPAIQTPERACDRRHGFAAPIRAGITSIWRKPRLLKAVEILLQSGHSFPAFLFVFEFVQ